MNDGFNSEAHAGPLPFPPMPPEGRRSSLYEQLREVALKDPTVYAYLKEGLMTQSDDLRVAVALIKQLAKEKAAYMQDAMNTRSMSISPVKPVSEGGML